VRSVEEGTRDGTDCLVKYAVSGVFVDWSVAVLLVIFLELEDFRDLRKFNHEELGREVRDDFSAKGDTESSFSKGDGMESVISIASSEIWGRADKLPSELLSVEGGERDRSFRPGEFDERRNLNHDREGIVG
jgi:hypothetical protein